MPRFRVTLDVYTDDVDVTEDVVTAELSDVLSLVRSGFYQPDAWTVDIDEVARVHHDAV